MNISLRRLGATIAGVAIAGSGLIAVAPSAGATTYASSERRTAASWLAGQVGANGLLSYESSYGPMTDVGLTIDAAMALKDTHGYGGVLTKMATGVAASTYGDVDSYDDWQTGEKIVATASNALAKKVVGLQVLSPSAVPLVAGEEIGGPALTYLPGLVKRLEDVTSDSGRISDNTTRAGVPDPKTDYANVFGQSFAARALTIAKSPEAPAAVDYLLDQQCSAGFFGEGIAAANAAVATCDASGEQPSIGGTATAVIQLAAIADSAGELTEQVKASLTSAANWLTKQQSTDGSFGADGTYGANANDTGLAGSALGVSGKSAAATKAAGWIANHQALPGRCLPANYRGVAGAIGYDDQALKDAMADGVDALAKGQWTRATVQSVASLAYLNASHPRIRVTTGYVSAGSKVTVMVSGLPTGRQLCLSGGKKPVIVTTNAKHTIVAPAGTATRRVHAETAASTVSAANLKVLAAKKLKPTVAAAKVKRGKNVTIKVTGLASAETVTVKVAGKKFKATASKKGVVTVKVPVAKKAKLGKTKVTVIGQFANRTGSTKVTVTK